jgi:Icc-related predicted phosphoesterase
MRIWHISDTHSYHYLLDIPEDIDMVIHSGDFSNYYDQWKNEPEAKDFLRWYGRLNIKYKILIAGNHDSFAANATKEFRELCNHYNIIYLENESVTIDGINIFGSPLTPSFGNWYFMKARHKLDDYWKQVPEDTDIMIVHGPPKGILDLSYSREGVLEFCGCKSLRNQVLNKIKPKLFLSGHIHNYEDIVNAGTMRLSGYDTTFSNGSVVTDRKFGILTSNGNILEYEKVIR